MLTLQNILDSDSIASLVAKLNVNFQTIALSNGGPQGVRGEQGIPGLPGRQGATGPSGPVGPQGLTMNIIPFSNSGTATGPVDGGGAFTPAPLYNPRSYEFLETGPNAWGPAGASGLGIPLSGELWFDNNEAGWWKYLTQPDPDPTTDTIDGNLSSYYVESPYYDVVAGGAYSGPGWYFYPINLAGTSQPIWEADKTNYLGLIAGSAYGSPAVQPAAGSQAPFGIPNARMASKFGTVWISSFDNDAPDDATVNTTGEIYDWNYLASARENSGIDRALFKMSIDGPRYYDNMKARGYRATDTGNIINSPYAVDSGAVNIPAGIYSAFSGIAGANPGLFVQPLYNVTIDAYAPIVFFGNRNDVGANPNNSTLGYYQYQPTGGGVTRIHNFSTRTNVTEFFDGPLTTSENVGETLFDVRRLVTSNQYLNMFPQDTVGYTSLAFNTPAVTISPYSPQSYTYLSEWNAAHPWHVYQGYHSVFTGQKTIAGSIAGNQTAATTLDTWIYGRRQSWYGTSIFEAAPDPEASTTVNELVRSAGMMARGHSDSTTEPSYVDTLIFYTSNMSGTGPNDYASPANANALLSLPVAHFSPARNFGVGTLSMDKIGVFEPTARLQSHADWRPLDDGFDSITHLTGSLAAGSYAGIDKSWVDYTEYAPLRRFKSAAFTIDRANPSLIYGTGAGGVFDGSRFATGPAYFDDWDGRGIFNDILLGAVDAPYNEISDPYASRTYLKPTAGIRYESFNYITATGPGYGIDHGNPARSLGWGFRGALRLGSSPYYTGPNASTPDNYEIGENANFQNFEYQLSFTPLAFSNVAATPGADLTHAAVTGVGVHNLYPRTRLHLFGKNIYQEFRFDEAAVPGRVEPAIAAATGVTRTTWPALPSSKQIVIDKIESTYVYNAALYDYAYDFTVKTAVFAPATAFTPNAKNYPTREAQPAGSVGLYPTTSTANSTLNISTLGITNGATGPRALHGGVWNAYWDLDKYIGFNLFRDLLDKGDARGEDVTGTYVNSTYAYDQYASVWRTGTTASALIPTKVGGTPTGPYADTIQARNGGAGIFSDSDGRLGISFLPKWRDGGANYGKWEQQGIGTREVVNNIKIVFDNGNVGIGNVAGIDENAYPSLRWNPNTYAINYLPGSGGTAGNPTTTGPVQYASAAAGWTPNSSNLYARADGAYGGGGAAATVNAKATLSEYIRLEIAGEKAQSFPGHTPDKRGYGYPGWKRDAAGLATGAGGSIVITDNSSNSFGNRYAGVPISTGGWGSTVYTITTDNLGRLISFTLDNDITSVAGVDILSQYPDFLLPHPTEFGVGGPLKVSPNTTTYPWLTGVTIAITVAGSVLSGTSQIWIPTSSVAAELQTLAYTNATGAATGVFVTDTLATANVRLNNFTVGDGYEFIRASGESQALTGVTDTSLATTQSIYQKRTASPKMLFTFGAPDYDAMAIAGWTPTHVAGLEAAGLAPLMKVTTVIESAQDEASLRTYTIPKADNTGGTFLVITDHMGETESDSPGLASLPETASATSRIHLDRVTSYEVQRTGIGMAATGPFGNYTFNPASSITNFGYEMLAIQYWENGFTPTTRGVEGQYYTQASLYGASPNSATNNFPLTGIAAAETLRNLSSYWEIDETTYASRFSDTPGEITTYKKSDIRYRRLNSNYLMFDFNITINPLDYMQMGDNLNIPLNRLLGAASGPVESDWLTVNNYVHSPYSAGFLTNMVSPGTPAAPAGQTGVTWVGIDARWLQYVRVEYDISEDNLFASAADNDAYFYENQFGGGANFSNWNDFRSWYPGSAVVGPWTPESQSLVSDDSNWIDTWDPLYGWVPGTDGSPYNRHSASDIRFPVSDANPNSYCTHAWNGRFMDWYWSSYTGNTRGFYAEGLTGPVGPSNVFNLQNTGFQAAAIASTGPLNNQLTLYVPAENRVLNYQNAANPWFTQSDYTLSAPLAIGGTRSTTGPTTLYSPGSTNAGWFKKTNINKLGYTGLQQGWWQSLEAPRGNGAVGRTGALAITTPVSVPQYFDAAVWRSFGDDAWNRSATFQWRVTPFYKQKTDASPAPVPGGLPADQQFNTFVLEIMFDKPIYVSGARREAIISSDYYDSAGAWPIYPGDVMGPNDTGVSPFGTSANLSMLGPGGTPGVNAGYGDGVSNRLPAGYAGEFGTLQNGAQEKSWSQFQHYLGNTTPVDGDQMAPYGSIELRGQAMIKYNKAYNYVAP